MSAVVTGVRETVFTPFYKYRLSLRPIISCPKPISAENYIENNVVYNIRLKTKVTCFRGCFTNVNFKYLQVSLHTENGG